MRDTLTFIVLNQLYRLSTQGRLMAEALGHKMIFEWLLIRKQLKTGAASELSHDAVRVTYR